jgi:hypothetical protein
MEPNVPTPPRKLSLEENKLHKFSPEFVLTAKADQRWYINTPEEV